MAKMSNALLQKLARSGEAKLRSLISASKLTFDYGVAAIQQLARWLFGQRSPDSPYTYVQYYNIARQVVANIEVAQRIQDQPATIIDIRTPSPGQPEDRGAYEYRSVIVGRNSDGEEIYSTLVYVYSDQLLTGNQIQEIASRELVAPTILPGVPGIPPPSPGQIIKIDVYVVSAGKR